MPSAAEDDAYAGLLARLDEVFPDGAANAFENFRAITGGTDDELTATAAKARRKIGQGAPLKPQEWRALETMVKLTRPAMLVREQMPEPLPPGKSRELFPQWDEVRNRLKPVIRSIGLIHKGPLPANPQQGIGTGFLVAPDLLLTNRHVAELLGGGEEAMGSVRFLWEDDFYGDEPGVEITAVAWKSVALDLALLKLKEQSTARRAVLASSETKPAAVVVVGHPFDDQERNGDLVKIVFGDKLTWKRSAPGRLSPMRPGVAQQYGEISHDCSTLGGNSGSPIFDIGTATVIGIHCGGDLLTDNKAISAGAAREVLGEWLK